MVIKWSLIALFLSGLPLSALANTCTTHSNGLSFSAVDVDLLYAEAEAVTACKYNAHTRNSECERNVYCTSRHGYPDTDLAYLLEGTFTTTNCGNCFLQVTRYGNQLYGQMTPWSHYGSYSGLEPILVIDRNEVQFRGDRFIVLLMGNQVTLRNITSDGSHNVAVATKLLSRYPNPRIPRMPPRYPTPPAPHYPPIRPNPPPPPVSSCPPGTSMDVYIGRCVSVATPPSRGPRPVRRN